MPIQPSYPGVYIQEVSSGVRTITGVSTSIAAFFGRTINGPVNKAVRCLSYSDFLREFGGGHTKSQLGVNVKQFFDNGGTDCYVVRLAHNPEKAGVTIKSLSKKDVLTIKAKNAGAWGNDLRVAIDYNTVTPDESFNLNVVQETGGKIIKSEQFLNVSMNPLSPRYAINFVNQGSKLIDLALPLGYSASTTAGYSESRRPVKEPIATLFNKLNLLIKATQNKFDINVSDGGWQEVDMLKLTPAFTGVDQPGIEKEFTEKINECIKPAKVACTLHAVDTDAWIIRIAADSGDKSSVRIRSAAADDLAKALMLGVDQGGIEVAQSAENRPAPNAMFFSGDINGLAKLKQSDINKFTFDGVNDIIVDLKTTAAGDFMYQDNYAPSANDKNDGVREKLNKIASTVNNTINSPVTAEVWGYHLAFKPKGGSYTNAYTVATKGTDLTTSFVSNFRQYLLGSTATNDYVVTGPLGKEDDGSDLEVGDYMGNPLDHTGFYALDKVDLFNLMVIPQDDDINESEYQQLFGPATTYCTSRRAFLLLDAPASWTNGEKMEADAGKVNALRAGIAKDYSAIFYPRVKYSDAGILKMAGPSGMIAGLMARTDSQRGVWKAPAGIDADLRGVLDVELNMTDGENGVLNKLGVNCIRKFPNGIVNWGARTLDGADDFGSPWKYIPIRRLALFLEESLFRGTKWVVFEPNDEPLWAKIRMNLNAFMLSLYRQGAFQGSTPDKAFFVKCDSETTTANDRNLGIVNIQVGFAPLKPAEFVIISIQQIPDV